MVGVYFRYANAALMLACVPVIVMLLPVVAASVPPVKLRLPCSTVKVTEDRSVSASVTDKAFEPVNVKSVLMAVVSVVVEVPEKDVPFSLFTGGSLLPLTVKVSVVVEVAPRLSVNS